MTNQSSDVQTLSEIEKKGIVVTFKSRKAERKVERDLTTLPYVSLMSVARYGAQRFINDKIGGNEIGSEKAAEIFDLWVRALDEGKVVRMIRVHDPVEAKARKLAREQIKQAVIAKGKRLKDVGNERITELASSLYSANAEAYLAQAQEVLEAERKAAETSAAKNIDLSCLNL